MRFRMREIAAILVSMALTGAAAAQAGGAELQAEGRRAEAVGGSEPTEAAQISVD